MLFSTSIFLFAFLPVCLGVYYGLLRDLGKRNRFLLIASVLFYAWGSIPHTFLLLGSIIVNWFFARLIQKEINQRRRRYYLGVAVAVNVFVLFVFKYLAFTILNINSLFQLDIQIPVIALPLGISFFTFQAMSYVIDVYRGNGQALSNPLDVGLYISLFPQLVAGPIVRFEDFQNQIEHREETLSQVGDGVFRFVYGLGKKVILADSLAIVAETAFNQPNPSLLMAWLGAIAFTLQIYFDFSGYSDMAIGLGKMFGFTFKENFNYPYISSSVSEFWRRWHISMGSWFRDYVYFPLGGSRVSKPRMFFNLFVVWVITGLWHGANWTFLAWGMLQFLAISVEKILGDNHMKGLVGRCFGVSYTLLFVILGWVFFNSASITDGAKYIVSMVSITQPSDPLAITLLRENMVILVLGVLFSTPLCSSIKNRIVSHNKWFESAVIVGIFLLSIIVVVKGSYSPFIYFNF